MCLNFIHCGSGTISEYEAIGCKDVDWTHDTMAGCSTEGRKFD
jgi:hypothetical protein